MSDQRKYANYVYESVFLGEQMPKTPFCGFTAPNLFVIIMQGL